VRAAENLRTARREDSLKHPHGAGSIDFGLEI
jgi:hypothetical protein